MDNKTLRRITLIFPLCLIVTTVCTDQLDKRYSAVVFATTHNAQSYLGPTFQTILSLQNQDEPISDQLHDGIRTMKIPIFWQDGNIVACHGISDAVKKEVKARVDAAIEEVKEKLPAWLRPLIDFTKESIGRLYLKSPLLPQKLLDLYYNPDNVDPGDLDPATRPLSSVLNEIATFLRHNPSEIVTLFLEVYYKNPAAIASVFEQCGLTKYLYVQPTSKPWPTLRTLIQQNKRLVVFVDFNVNHDKYPFNKKSAFVWSSPYAFAAASTLMKDSGNEPSSSWTMKNRLWVLQHFVTPLIAGDKDEAEKVNAKAVILARVARYQKKWDLPKPNFIWVDFYDTPKKNGVLAAVNELNSAS